MNRQGGSTMTTKNKWMRIAATAVLAAACMSAGTAAAEDKYRVALLVKNLGNGFFDAAHQGGDEAAKELGDIELIYTGPTTPTAEGQIEIINSLIAQKVNAIVISANDPDALVPVCKKAAQRGITVRSRGAATARRARPRRRPRRSACSGSRTRPAR